jgi:hypothetical protein
VPLGTDTVSVAAAGVVEFTVTLVLFRLAVTPYDEALRVIVPLNRKTLLNEIVDWAEPPDLMIRNCGLALMLKSGPMTSTLTKNVCESEPLLPVTAIE